VIFQIQSKANNYSPFGLVTPGRSFSAGDGYRFGFNGKESDAETYGSGNSYDYGFRIYNPRLGKFLSVDPIYKAFSWYTPYQFAGNKPIWAIDLDGLEEKEITGPNSYLITATYAVSQDVVNNVDIIELQNQLNSIFNANPTAILDNQASIITEDVLELIDNISNTSGLMDDGPGDAPPLHVIFDIKIVAMSPSDDDPNDLSKSRIWTKSGQSLGGKIVMGQTTDPEFKDKPIVDPATGVETGQVFETHAYQYLDAIYLNPVFFDKSNPNYVGKSSLEQYRTISHEIGHDMGLRHPVQNYPTYGNMSNQGSRTPTIDEINRIIDPLNDDVIQPGKKY